MDTRSWGNSAEAPWPEWIDQEGIIRGIERGTDCKTDCSRCVLHVGPLMLHCEVCAIRWGWTRMESSKNSLYAKLFGDEK